MLHTVVCVDTDRQQEKEKEKGVRSLNNGQSKRLPKSQRIASLQENNSAKVLNDDTIICLCVKYQMMPLLDLLLVVILCY